MATPSNHNRIDYIELPVIDMAATKKFYGAVFDWSFTDWAPTYVSFNDGRLEGGFRHEETVAPGGPLVVMYADDLEAARRRVVDAGGKIETDIFSFPGGRRFQFVDPSGNILAVWSDVGAED